jgi:hypothetical protein
VSSKITQVPASIRGMEITEVALHRGMVMLVKARGFTSFGQPEGMQQQRLPDLTLVLIHDPPPVVQPGDMNGVYLSNLFRRASYESNLRS